MKLMMTTIKRNFTATTVLSVQIEITYIIEMFITRIHGLTFGLKILNSEDDLNLLFALWVD